MTAPYRVDERVRYSLPLDTPNPIGALTATLQAAQDDYCARHGVRPGQLDQHWATVRVQDGHLVVTFVAPARDNRPRVLDLTGAATQLLPRLD